MCTINLHRSTLLVKTPSKKIKRLTTKWGRSLTKRLGLSPRPKKSTSKPSRDFSVRRKKRGKSWRRWSDTWCPRSSKLPRILKILSAATLYSSNSVSTLPRSPLPLKSLSSIKMTRWTSSQNWSRCSSRASKINCTKNVRCRQNRSQRCLRKLQRPWKSRKSTRAATSHLTTSWRRRHSSTSTGTCTQRRLLRNALSQEGLFMRKKILTPRSELKLWPSKFGTRIAKSSSMNSFISTSRWKSLHFTSQRKLSCRIVLRSKNSTRSSWKTPLNISYSRWRAKRSSSSPDSMKCTNLRSRCIWLTQCL